MTNDRQMIKHMGEITMLDMNIIDTGHSEVTDKTSIPLAAYYKEMNYTITGFIRQLKSITGTRVLELDEKNRCAKLIDGKSVVTVNFSKAADRQLGSLTLPVVKVEIRFDGYTDGEVIEFITCFDRAVLRMGGG